MHKRSLAKVRDDVGRFSRKFPDPKVGDRFNNWEVLEPPVKNLNNNHRRCLCRCICGEEKRVNVKHLHTGESKGCHCTNLGKRIRPYEAAFNLLVRQCREYSVELTYEDYLDFTKDVECHYCGYPIQWDAYNLIAHKNCGHHLDRKDNSLGYSKENCVVCCPRCNRAKSNHFTYEEWVQIGALIKSWKMNHLST